MIAAMFQHSVGTVHSSSSCFTSASAVFIFSNVFLIAASGSSSVGKFEIRGGIQQGFETHCHRGTKHGFLRTASDQSVISPAVHILYSAKVVGQ
jgi:hypothetical protein